MSLKRPDKGLPIEQYRKSLAKCEIHLPKNEKKLREKLQLETSLKKRSPLANATYQTFCLLFAIVLALFAIALIAEYMLTGTIKRRLF
jgi:hypothetical protein